MTVQYQGKMIYEVKTYYQNLVLTDSEIEEIQNFDFKNMRNFDKTNQELEEKIENLENLFQELSENFEFLQEIFYSDEVDTDAFESRTKKIYDNLAKMQGI